MTQEQQKTATSLSEELDKIGDEHRIYRNHDETDNDFGWRLLHGLDVLVEEIWEVQDEIRALIRSSTTGQE
jgi:hypothetical protein